MCTIRLIEFIVAWQNCKPVTCRMHAFLQNAIIFTLLYSGTAVLYEPISKLCIYKNSAVYLSNCNHVFCIEKADYTVILQVVLLLLSASFVIESYNVPQNSYFDVYFPFHFYCLFLLCVLIYHDI